MKMGEATNVPGLSWDGTAWVIRLKIEHAGVKTERRRRIEGTKTDALEALAALRREMEQAAKERQSKREDPEIPTTVGDFAPLWMKSLAARRKTMKPAFLETRRRYLERFILPVFGESHPADVKPKDLERWKLWLAEQRQGEKIGKRDNPKGGQLYARTVLITAWATARLLFRFVSLEAEVKNPMTGLIFDVDAGTEKKSKAALTIDELAAVLREAEKESPDIKTMIVLGFATGLRFAELSALEWRDVDLDKGTIRIERSQVSGDVGPPKTEATRRLVYIVPEIVELLRAHRRWQMTEMDPSRHIEEGSEAVTTPKRHLLFPSRRGGYRIPQMLAKPLQNCAKRAHVDKHITAHVMRKTANNLIRAAAGGIVARAMIGHADDEMTFTYSDVDANERGRAHRAAFGSVFDKRGT
jgi:integrase